MTKNKESPFTFDHEESDAPSKAKYESSTSIMYMERNVVFTVFKFTPLISIP